MSNNHLILFDYHFIIWSSFVNFLNTIWSIIWWIIRSIMIRFRFDPFKLNLKAEIRRSFITTTVREQNLNRRSHYKGATCRVRTGNRQYPVLCLCQLGQDIIPYLIPIAMTRYESHIRSSQVIPSLHLEGWDVLYNIIFCYIANILLHNRNLLGYIAFNLMLCSICYMTYAT